MGKVDKSRQKRSKHKDRSVGTFASVQARNEQKWLQKEEEKEGSSSEESEEEAEPKEKDPNVYVKERSENVMAKFAQMNLEDAGANAPPAQPTRKEREAMQKEAARKRYEKMHAEGKTEEAQADLARLEKIKAERAAVKKAREEADEKAKAAKHEGNLREEYVKNLGGETAGKRKKDKKDKKEKKEKRDKNESDDSDKEDFVNPYGTDVGKTASSNPYGTNLGDSSSAGANTTESTSSGKKIQSQRNNEGLYEAVTAGLSKPEEADPSTFQQGSIEACRAEEDDFM